MGTGVSKGRNDPSALVYLELFSPLPLVEGSRPNTDKTGEVYLMVPNTLPEEILDSKTGTFL